MSYRVALGCSLCNTINVKNMHPHQDLGGKEASLLPSQGRGGGTPPQLQFVDNKNVYKS